jgi:outer membrane protein assembly factor BamB
MNVESNQKDWVSAKLGAASAITHADMNGDAIQDLIGLTSDGYIYAWDVAHQTLIWSSTSLGSGKDLGVADLDGDGVPEIVGLTGSNVITFAKSQATGTWLETGRYALSGQDLLLADTDGDGKPEIFVLGVATTGGALKVFKLDGRLQLLHSFAAYNLAGIYLEASDFPRKNLLATLSTGSYSTPTPPRIVALDPNTGALVWQSPALLGTTPLNSLETIDLNKDGKRRISFGTSKGMCVTR